jgi:hypothetical protein
MGANINNNDVSCPIERNDEMVTMITITDKTKETDVDLSDVKRTI